MRVANEKPLRPDESEYRTSQITNDNAPTGDPLEPGSATEGEVARPWGLVGLILLGVFAAILVYAIVLPLFT